MTDLIGGRYRLAGPIGRGGMGEVFRAEDLLARAPVCLKRARAHDTPSAVLARVRREFRVGQMVTHPHLMPILDLIEEGDEPWLVMELIDGPSLEALLERCGGEALPAAGVVALGLQLALGLDWFHRWVGEKHRDIKPGNVLIEPASPAERGALALADLVPAHGAAAPFRAMIADFGLATGETRISRTEAVPGTLLFTAPEVLRLGKKATIQSDLYSLGRTLECAALGCPQPPAVEPTSTDTLRELVGDRLGRALGRLLAPDPAERFPSAAELGRALTEIEQRGSRPLAAPSGRPHSLVRRDQLDELLRICDAPLGREGRMVLLRGAVLSGRATLLHRLGEALDAPAITVRRGDEAALAPIARLAQDLIAAAAASEAARRERVLGDDEGALRLLIKKAEAPRGERASAGDALMQALGRVLRRFLDDGGSHLLIHDLDLAPPETLAALQRVIEACGRMTLVASAGLDRRSRGLEGFLAAARRRWVEIHEIECAELSPREAALWLRRVCPDAKPAAVRELAERALDWFGRGARAFSMGAALLQAERLLELDDSGSPRALAAEDWPVAGRLGAAYARMSEELGEAARRVLAALGAGSEHGLAAAELAAGLGSDQEAASEALERLHLRGLARIAAGAGDRPSYAPAARMLVDPAVAEAVAEGDFHLRVAGALDTGDEPITLHKCAFHLERAGRLQDAIEKLGALARRLDPVAPPAAAAQRLHALSLGPAPEMRPALLLEAAHAAVEHQPPEARRLYAEVLERLELAPPELRPRIECEARWGMVVVARLMGCPAEMTCELKTLDAMGALDRPLEELRLLAHAAPNLETHPDEALALLERCAPESADGLGRVATRWADYRFYALYFSGRFDDAQEHAGYWRDAALAAGDDVAMSIFLQHLANARAVRRRSEEAEATFRDALELAEQTGAALRIVQTALNFGRFLTRDDKVAEARAVFSRAEPRVESCGPYHQARFRYDLGTLYARVELWDSAVEHYSRSLAGLEKLGHRHRFLVAANLAEAHLSTGDTAAARAAFELLVTQVREKSDLAPSTRDSLLAWARILEGMLLRAEGRAGQSLEVLRSEPSGGRQGAAQADLVEHQARALCEALRSLGRAAEAEPIARERVQRIDTDRQVARAPAARRQLAEIQAELGKSEDALGELKIARGVAVALRQRREESRIFVSAARVHEKSDDMKLSLRCRATARALREWLRAGLVNEPPPITRSGEASSMETGRTGRRQIHP